MQRQISFGQALATVVGSVIGAGVFFKIGTITQQTGSPSMTIFVWILAGLISICSGLTVSEIAAALNVNGAIEYLDYAYGNIWGFLFGWAEMAVYFPAQIAALSAIFGEQFVTLLGLKGLDSKWVALALVLFLLGINLLGTKAAARMQAVVTVIKLIPLALIIFFGFLNPHPVAISLFPPAPGADQSWLGAVSQGLLSALFAFEGWIIVTNLAKEVRDPTKDLSRAIIIGLSVVTVIYVLINYAFMTVLPFGKIAGNQNTAFYASLRLFGPVGGKFVTTGILISVYGACNGFMLTGIRTPFILAQAGRLPFSSKLGRSSVRTGVPVFSALLVDAIALVMIALGNFDILTDMLVFVMWTFTTLLSVAVFILRKREPELERPFKAPGYPLIPLISVIGGLFIIVMTVINQFVLSVIGLGLTLLGLPIYYWVKMTRD